MIYLCRQVSASGRAPRAGIHALGVWRERGLRSGDGCSSKSVEVIGKHVVEEIEFCSSDSKGRRRGRMPSGYPATTPSIWIGGWVWLIMMSVPKAGW